MFFGLDVAGQLQEHVEGLFRLEVVVGPRNDLHPLAFDSRENGLDHLEARYLARCTLDEKFASGRRLSYLDGLRIALQLNIGRLCCRRFGPCRFGRLNVRKAERTLAAGIFGHNGVFKACPFGQHRVFEDIAFRRDSDLILNVKFGEAGGDGRLFVRRFAATFHDRAF